MDLQPNPLSAMQMIAEEPIRIVHGRKAVCDGGTSDAYTHFVTAADQLSTSPRRRSSRSSQDLHQPCTYFQLGFAARQLTVITGQARAETVRVRYT